MDSRSLQLEIKPFLCNSGAYAPHASSGGGAVASECILQVPAHPLTLSPSLHKLGQCWDRRACSLGCRATRSEWWEAREACVFGPFPAIHSTLEAAAEPVPLPESTPTAFSSLRTGNAPGTAAPAAGPGCSPGSASAQPRGTGAGRPSPHGAVSHLRGCFRRSFPRRARHQNRGPPPPGRRLCAALGRAAPRRLWRPPQGRRAGAGAAGRGPGH